MSALRPTLSSAVLALPLLFGATQAQAQPSWTPQLVDGVFRPSPQVLQAAAEETSTFAPEFVEGVALELANRNTSIPSQDQSVGAAFLRDIDGAPAGFALLMTTAPGTPDSPAMALALDQLTLTARQSLDADDLDARLEAMAALYQSADYATILVGAGPTRPRLGQLRNGLPPGAFALIAPAAVSNALGIPAHELSFDRAFYEPRMPRGYDQGVLVRRGAQRFVFVAPSPAQPGGLAVTEASYRSQMAEMVALAEPIPGESTRRWGQLAVTQGPPAAELSQVCAFCDPGLVGLWQEGFHQGLESGFGGFDNDGCGNCRYVYDDGTEVGVSSCDNYGDECCPWVDGEYQDNGNCLVKCSCNCSTSSTSTLGRVIEGVPNYFQHDIGATICHSNTVVGCGAVAAAALVSWHDAMGHSALTAGHVDSSGAVEWQDLAEDLTAWRYLRSFCVPFSGGMTATFVDRMAKGLRNFYSDNGHTLSTNYFRIGKNDTTTGFSRIRSEVNDERPMVMGFCSDPSTCGDLGFTDLTTIDIYSNLHIGLVVGYEDDNAGERVHLDVGWRGFTTEVFDWDVQSGTVRMFTANVSSATDTAASCHADAMWSAVTPWSSDVDYTGRDLSWPVENTIVGSNCNLLKDEVTSTHFGTKSYHCLTEEEAERIEESIEDLEQDYDWEWPTP